MRGSSERMERVRVRYCRQPEDDIITRKQKRGRDSIIFCRSLGVIC
jgi:hypothetical protein